MKFRVVWAMPNKATFTIPPIREFINGYIQNKEKIIVDPFRGESNIGNVTNDIRETGLDSLVWLRSIKMGVADVVLFDPPYTPRQLKECYESIGIPLHDTTAGYWAKLKDEVSRVSHTGSIVLSFGYGQSHMGMKRQFDIIDGLVVLHGGMHNATICTAEVKR